MLSKRYMCAKPPCTEDRKDRTSVGANFVRPMQGNNRGQKRQNICRGELCSPDVGHNRGQKREDRKDRTSVGANFVRPMLERVEGGSVGYLDRILCESLQAKVISAQAAAAMIMDGMVVGASGFTPAGYPKAIPIALAERVKKNGERLKIALLTGASVGMELDDVLAEAGIIGRRSPYQTSAVLRKSLNMEDGVDFFDEHLSLHAQNVRYGFYGCLDLAIIEACAITAEGHIVPTTSVGASPSFVQAASKVLVELNLSQPLALQGMHDIYIPQKPPHCLPIPLTHSNGRIGTTFIPCEPEKIAGIVISELADEVRPLRQADDNARAIADHICCFLRQQAQLGCLPQNLLPLQSGV
ncbi:MAG: hypothetical protein FWG43_06710, partial [Clostridiales bacterium]|nr:hypothetical protein [Clostridiales bacterium]